MMKSSTLFEHATLPPYVHLMSTKRHSCDRCSQPFPVFALFRFRVLYWTKPKKKKTGEAWERGYPPPPPKKKERIKGNKAIKVLLPTYYFRIFSTSLASWIVQLKTVIVEVFTVQALRLRANPWRLHGAKHFCHQWIWPTLTQFFQGQTNYLSMKVTAFH